MADWAVHLVQSAGLAGIFLLMFLETVFPPIPSEVIMPLAGMQAAQGGSDLAAVIFAGTVGAMLGNWMWYAAARWIGATRFRGWIERHGRWLTLEWSDVERVQRLFARFGGWLAMFGRMIPTVRSVVSIPAGLVRMPARPFLIWSTIGTAGWTALLAITGYVLGQRHGVVNQVAGPVAIAVIALALLTYVWRQVRWSRHRR